MAWIEQLTGLTKRRLGPYFWQLITENIECQHDRCEGCNCFQKDDGPQTAGS
jgi:hypothetical protein